jgi:hypothetical protein
MNVFLICVSSCSGFALGCFLPPCLYTQCTHALVPRAMSVLLIYVSSWVFPATVPLLSVCSCLVSHVVSVFLICVRSCSGFALGCSLPPVLYSQCAPDLVPHVVSVLLFCVRSCSGFALGCSLPPYLYSKLLLWFLMS